MDDVLPLHFVRNPDSGGEAEQSSISKVYLCTLGCSYYAYIGVSIH